MYNKEITTEMKRLTRLFGLLFTVWLLAASAAAQSYTIRFAAGTERIDRGRAGTGLRLDELTDRLSDCKPRLERGGLMVRLTALQNVVDRLDPEARAQALQQALALKEYLISACCLAETTVFDITVDAQTDLNNRVIAEVVAASPGVGETTRTTHPHTETVAASASRPASTVKQSQSAGQSVSAPAGKETSKALPVVPSRPVYCDEGVGFGVKTNVLLFAGVVGNGPMYSPAPNLAVEMYFLRRFSAQLSFAYGMPYSKGDKNNVFELMGVEVEPRVWLRGDGSFRGLYGGLYVQYGTFDVRVKEELADNCSGSYMGVGLSVGWLQPIWKGFYAEAGVQAGYRSDAVDVYEFTPKKANKRLAGYTLTSFTLQGLNLSVGYRF